MQTAPVKSLAGVRILITRSKTENRTLSKKLSKLGGVTVELPTIEVVLPEDLAPLDRSIKILSKFDWLIFTSRQGVRFFGERMVALGESVDALREVKIAAIGPATADELQRLGRKPDYMPEEFLSERIVYGLGDISGKWILLPRADIASRRLPELLREQGGNVEEVVAYRTVVPEDLSFDRFVSILKNGVDVVTFTSPSTVRNLASVANPNPLESLLKDIKVACIGPVTSDAAKALGVHVDVVASNHTIDDLVEAIVNEIGTI